MKVTKTYKTRVRGHVIEFGWSTWNPKEPSVRSRYLTKKGGFSPHSSSELPIEDLEPLIKAAAKHGVLKPKDCGRMIQYLAEAIIKSC